MKMRMLPPGFAMVAMAVLVSGEMNLDDRSWSDACKGPVCGVAEKQAEGLARLRVLSDYIKETMSLMESVVSSLDDEMMEVGQELRNVVGRRCHSRGSSALTYLITRMNHADELDAENRIIEDTSDSDDNWASSDMTQGSTSTLLDDVGAVLGSPSGASHSTSQRPGSISHSTYHSTYQRPSSTSHSTTYSTSRLPTTYSTSHSTSQSSSSSSNTASRSTGKTVSRRPSSSQKYEAQPSATMTPLYVAPEQPEETDIWRGGGGRGQGIGRGQGVGQGQGRGRGHGRGRGERRGHGQGGSGPRASNCRGVPVGSPHYVPNLDSWCAKNCPHGMCPTTHCVC